MDDLDRTLICEVCGEPACCGSRVTVDGIRMGDVGSWRCAEHHPDRKPRYSREEWAAARDDGRLSPDSPAGEWQQLGDITNRLLDTLAQHAKANEAAE